MDLKKELEFFINKNKNNFMAIVVLKDPRTKSKPIKEHIDLALEHKHYKHTTLVYKVLFFCSLILNILGISYIILK